MSFFSRALALPHTITAVKTSDYDNRSVLVRENGLRLYGPNTRNPLMNIINSHEIVLPVTDSRDTALSLYRCGTVEEAHAIFHAYKIVVPYFKSLRSGTSELQEVCNFMRENPRFSLAHIAVKLNKIHLLEDPAVLKYVDDSECGLTPIMVAIEVNNLKTVQLLSSHCDLDILDSGGKSVLHYAARGDSKILEFLLSKLDNLQLLKQTDFDGRTPLFYAVTVDNTSTTEMLINSGADLNSDPVSVKNEIIHACKSSDMLKCLVNLGAPINGKNSEGLSPLHTFVNYKDFDMVMNLLLHNANTNITNDNGETPLHFAVSKSSVDIIKALLVFGADPNCVNNSNKSPRHLINLADENGAKILAILNLSGAQRCPRAMSGCRDSCSYSGDNNGSVTSISLDFPINPMHELLNVASMENAVKENRTMKGGRLLCLDGGGIRGLILIQILMAIQKETNVPIIKLFDWVAGTSTGGILALALASGKTLEECRTIYFLLKSEVFKGSKPYSSEELEKHLKKYFGDTTCISSIKEPKIMVTSVIFEKSPFQLHLFRNYPSPADILANRSETLATVNQTPIWEVLRATSAAPVYFYPSGIYIDGGIIANNPTFDALTEMLEYGLALRAIKSKENISFASVVVSCGTGVVPTTSVIGSFSQFEEQIQSIEKSSKIGKLIAASHLIFKSFSKVVDIISDVITGADGRFVDRARAWCCTAGVPYYRFSPPMSIDVPLDETSNIVIVQVLWETMVYMQKNKVLAKEMIACLQRD